eukprot:TRINITY_DN97154_c0_g1_i1.p1 TRINITY_DN97154_c0_g1~~TRINITY_DN97154_c0_g1_i1.p1  ORF type:complete len:312 (+),score=76.40 TRINITY_DN97154_c0_g1_i1:25-936(+)
MHRLQLACARAWTGRAPFTLLRARRSWQLRSATAFAGAGLAGNLVLTACRPVSCDGDAIVQDIAGALLPEDLARLRSAVAMLRATTGVDEQHFLEAARSAYVGAVDPDGMLRLHRLEEVLAAARQNQAGRRWPWQHVVHTVTISELGPILLRLLDENRDGNVSQREFLLGQALIYAAAKAHTATEITELCWRALDSNGDGAVELAELRTALKVMVAVHSVSRRDMHEQLVQIKRNHGPPMTIHRVRSVEELAQYYLDMYDSDLNGKISRDEFCRHGALQENFWRLLTSPEFEPCFLCDADSAA